MKKTENRCDLSSFTQPLAISNLFDFLSSTKQDILKNVGNRAMGATSPIPLNWFYAHGMQ